MRGRRGSECHLVTWCNRRVVDLRIAQSGFAHAQTLFAGGLQSFYDSAQTADSHSPTVLINSVRVAGSTWVVRQDGVGPAKLGMNPPQLNMALHDKFAMPQDKGASTLFPESTRRCHS